MRKLLILFAIVLTTTPLAAQWRRAGLFGADVRALIADPANPDTLYLGTSSGEVYVSRDAAKSWTNPRNGTPFPNYIVDNLLLDRDGQLWAASWGLWGGGVIAVSKDSGKTWERRDAGLEDFSVRAIAVDPNDSNFVVVGGLTGVYRSTNAGRKWEKISEQINVESLAIDPRSRDRIFVGTWRQGWRTDDGGKNWKHIADGMVLDTDMFSITIDPKQPDNVWVATCGWVYNSLNGGDKWTRYRDGFNNRRIHDVEIDPCDEDVVYAGSVAGLYRSEDKGKSWYVMSDEGMVINSIVLHPQRPQRIILGIEGDGVYVSNDRGKTYQRSSEGLHNLRITTVAPDPFEKNRIYATVVHGGAASGIYRSNDAGKSWEKASRGVLPEVLTLTMASEADAEVKFIAGTEKGFFFSNDGEEWTQAEPSSFPIRVEKVVRFNRLRSFAATNEGVFTTRDGGRSWYRLGGATNRAVDIAVGSLDGNKALYALTAAGLEVFDGAKWNAIAGAPSKGRTLAIRHVEGQERVFVAGMHGVKAGAVSAERAWEPMEAPDTQYAVVHGGSRTSGQMLFLTSRQQREILVGEPTDAQWSELTLPGQNTEVTSVVPDPFTRERYYVATLGDGIFVYEGKMRRYVPREPEVRAQAVAPGSPGSK
ncbi:MAG TPA: YCF48-related protein [Thermoanaerobaculia bacterium]|nr:YCF48-related protein [Thermoanaerobaculia bacterium]